MKTDILIVGGGLSGLWLAWQLEQQGHSYQLVEARNRYGGRIHSHKQLKGSEETHFDVGPSWFWPGQSRIASLTEELGLKSFLQHADGELSYEDEAGRVQRGYGFSSMQGSYRVSGSLVKLIQSIEQKIPATRLRMNARVTQISKYESFIKVLTVNERSESAYIESNKVVLALPPRVIEKNIHFIPELSNEVSSAMKNIPTWMAGNAKIIACYNKPFWREKGLSGDAISQRGPMVEIHDASPENGGPYALFGFVGVPTKARQSQRQAILDAAQHQLFRLFGEQANIPLSLTLQDWAFELETATPLDHTPLRHHPEYGLPKCLSNLWGGSLILSSTEAAEEFGGYLEGALEAANTTLNRLTQPI